MGSPRTNGAWLEYFTAEEGLEYYYNEETGVTQWEKPADFDFQGPLGANLFIFHVPSEWTLRDLVAHFRPFGRVTSASIATDRATLRNRGFAFVSYDQVAAAAQAIQHMNGFSVGNKRLKVNVKQNEEHHIAHLLQHDNTAHNTAHNIRNGPHDGTANSAPAYNQPPYNALPYNAAAHTHGGPAYSGPAYNGPAYSGPAYNGPAYNGSAHNGPVYSGSAYDGSAYNGSVYSGARMAPAARPPMGHEEVPLNTPPAGGPVPTGYQAVLPAPHRKRIYRRRPSVFSSGDEVQPILSFVKLNGGTNEKEADGCMERK